MGAQQSAGSPRVGRAAPVFPSYEQVLRELQGGKSEQYANDIQALLVRVAESCVRSYSAAGRAERAVTRDQIRQMVELLHETLSIVGVDCYGCAMARTAHELLNSAHDKWTPAEAEDFLRRYALNVCGFVDSDDSKWYISDTVLARIAERYAKTKAVVSFMESSPSAAKAEKHDRQPPEPGVTLPTAGRQFENALLGAVEQQAAADDKDSSEEDEVDDIDVGIVTIVE